MIMIETIINPTIEYKKVPIDFSKDLIIKIPADRAAKFMSTVEKYLLSFVEAYPGNTREDIKNASWISFATIKSLIERWIFIVYKWWIYPNTEENIKLIEKSLKFIDVKKKNV